MLTVAPVDELIRCWSLWGCLDFWGRTATSSMLGSEQFRALADEEPGTFYLTDFLVRHFDRLVVGDLKLDEHPELEAMLFGAYKRMVYLAQSDNLRELGSGSASGRSFVTAARGCADSSPGLASPIEAEVLQWRKSDLEASCNA